MGNNSDVRDSTTMTSYAGVSVMHKVSGRQERSSALPRPYHLRMVCRVTL